MQKVICFGAGHIGRVYLANLSDATAVLAFADNNTTLHGTYVFGHPVVAPARVCEYEYDSVVITVDDALEDTTTGKGLSDVKRIYAQLLALGAPESKIELQSTAYSVASPRVVFLRHLSEVLRESGVTGATAECGVFRGEFASHINEYFPDSRLYLFDTFEGFKEADMAAEHNSETVKWLKSQDISILSTGSEFTAYLRCRHKANVIIKKGWVPETFAGCEDERFAFVNLDMDLYAPQLAGLRFFAPRMTDGGVILLHDYYWKPTPGVKQAVDACAKDYNFRRMPIGDNSSIALLF
jgi:O-methyltransferase